MLEEYFPIIILLAGSVIAIIFNYIAALRRNPDKDTGDYWVFVVASFTIISLILFLLSAWAVLLPSYWFEGAYHLYIDVLPNALNLTVKSLYQLALLIPFMLGLLLLIIGIVIKPNVQARARWLAGAIYYENKRYWISSYFVLPLLFVSFFTVSDLGGGPGAYPAAIWGTMAVFIIALMGVALSGPKFPPKPATNKELKTKLPPLEREAWPQIIKAGGIQLKENIATWEADEPTRSVQGNLAENMLKRCSAMGAHQIEPELIEAMAILLNPQQKEDKHRLVLAPDDCGQMEVIALAAKILEQRNHTATLVITVSNAKNLAEQLKYWVADAGKVSAFEPSNQEFDAMIWVVDAETLSDHLLPLMKDHKIVEKIGFVVWWHLEDYTGVLAANLWAISRRLDRLIQHHGRHDVRTLALIRNTANNNDQIDDFLNLLLPHKFAKETYVQIQAHFYRQTYLHILESHEDFFKDKKNVKNRKIGEAQRNLLLTTTKVSVENNWSTFLENPDGMSIQEIEAFLQLPVKSSKLKQEQLNQENETAVNNATLKQEMTKNVDKADVRLMPLHCSDILAIVERLSQTGRASETSKMYHVGLSLPNNPYVHYLISTLSTKQEESATLGFGTSKQLVGAEPNQAIISRHLNLALNELEDTRSNLLKTFLLDEKTIYNTLEKLDKQNQLSQEEVRYLDENSRLIIEPKYNSSRLPDNRYQPLNTVNVHQLIKVCDPTKQGEIQMWVDPERLTIQAYPSRVFMCSGQRYQINDWSQDSLEQKKSIECHAHTTYSETWRIRNISVEDIEPLLNEIHIDLSKTGESLIGLRVNLNYEEVVKGVFTQKFNLTTCQPLEPERTRFLNHTIAEPFPTRGFVLGFDEPQEANALISLSQALRHVLPVHIGVEEDALEIVPVEMYTETMDIYGIVIVDLYPEGIGLVDELRNNRGFILSLLEWTKEWLENCPCQSDDGCEKCLRTVSAMAAVGDDKHQLPKRINALKILEKVV